MPLNPASRRSGSVLLQAEDGHEGPGTRPGAVCGPWLPGWDVRPHEPPVGAGAHDLNFASGQVRGWWPRAVPSTWASW